MCAEHKNWKAELPLGPLAAEPKFGSDRIAQTLRELGLPYIALNPGASFRGLHDSLVNLLGNEMPEMLLCLHEEHAVHIAQGYAKVTDRPMACAIHSNVGLMHASMAIFNAWCDRMPMMVIGAGGPYDAARRRPWIDWIHTTRDQGALVRNYIKYDDAPSSPAAAREALARAYWHATKAPKGPVYVNLDVCLQEDPVGPNYPQLDLQRFIPKVSVGASEEDLQNIADLVRAAQKIVLVYGRFSRSEENWSKRIEFAEKIGAGVISDGRIGISFPTDHPQHIANGIFGPVQAVSLALRDADLILAFDAVDLAGLFITHLGGEVPNATIVHVSMDHSVHNGWSMDHQGLPPIDHFVSGEPDLVLSQILKLVSADAPRSGFLRADRQVVALRAAQERPLVRDLAVSLKDALGERDVCLLSTTIAWHEDWWPWRHPLDFTGGASGGGLGAGPGICVGGALALRGTGRMAVGIVGDGDFLMGVTAIWTAVRYRLPLLIVVANNTSFYNDEIHQEKVATMRERPIANKWIGQKMIDPDVDLTKLAEGQGAEAFGPIERIADLAPAFAAAIAIVEQGGVAVVDVRVVPGYA